VGKYLTDGRTHCCCKLSNVDLLPGSSRSASASVAAPAERPCHGQHRVSSSAGHLRTRHAARETTRQQPVTRRAAGGCLLMHQAQNRQRHWVAPACAQGDHKRSKKPNKAGTNFALCKNPAWDGYFRPWDHWVARPDSRPGFAAAPHGSHSFHLVFVMLLTHECVLIRVRARFFDRIE